MSKNKVHYYILDTSALLFDPASLISYPESLVIIPVSVLEELDKHKDRQDEVGKNARTVNRKLYELKSSGDLSKGVLDTESRVTVQIFPENIEDIPTSLNKDIADNKILSVCFTVGKTLRGSKKKITLVTNDLNLGLKAEAYGIKTEAFVSAEIFKPSGYKGHRLLEEDSDLSIDHIYQYGYIDCPKRLKLNNNEYCLITNKAKGKQSVRVKYLKGKLYRLPNDYNAFGIEPRNNEQDYALDLLLDPEIKLVTLTGLAGSGKTLLSVAAGLKQTLEKDDKLYDRLLISRSLVVLSGKDRLGYLKGGLKEKLDPYLLPLKDAIDQVVGENSGFDYLTLTSDSPNGRKPKIEIEALQYIRGRSLRGVYFIVDEAQNLTLAELKAIISRMGEGSKIVLLGDLEQIDNQYLTPQTSGLAQVIEKFKDSEIAGHVQLIEGVRSKLATEAAERL